MIDSRASHWADVTALRANANWCDGVSAGRPPHPPVVFGPNQAVAECPACHRPSQTVEVYVVPLTRPRPRIEVEDMTQVVGNRFVPPGQN